MTSPPPSASLPKTGREQSEFWRLPHQGTKATRHPQGQDFPGMRTLRTTGRCRTWLQPRQAVSERGLGQGAGAQSAIQQSRIDSGPRWLQEALLQHFNDTWAEYFAFLCIKPHSAGMRLRPLWYIIYIKIPPPASQHDFHVPPPFKIAEEYICEDRREGETSFFNIHWAGSGEDASIRRVQLMWKCRSFEKKELNTKTGSVQLNWSPKGQW